MRRAVVAILAFSSVVSAQVTDDFEDIGQDGSAVSSRVVGGVYITLQNDEGAAPEARTYFQPPHAFRGAGQVVNAPAVPANVSGTRFIYFGGTLQETMPIRIDLSQPVYGFGLTTIDLLENASQDNSTVFLRGLDSNLQFLTQQTRTGPQGPTGLDLDWWITSPQGISTVLLLGSHFGASYFGVDDFVVQVANPVGVDHGSWGAVKALYRKQPLERPLDGGDVQPN